MLPSIYACFKPNVYSNIIGMTDMWVIDKREKVRNHSLVLTIASNCGAANFLNDPHISSGLINQATGRHILLQQRRDCIIRLIKSEHDLLSDALKVATPTKQVMLVIDYWITHLEWQFLGVSVLPTSFMAL